MIDNISHISDTTIIKNQAGTHDEIDTPSIGIKFKSIGLSCYSLHDPKCVVVRQPKAKKSLMCLSRFLSFPPLNAAAVDEMIQRDPEPLDAQDLRCT